MNRDFFFISDFQLLQTHKFGTGFVLDLSFTIPRNTAKVGIKHQSINQSFLIKQDLNPIDPMSII
jgi:hypothetical protein